jgi:protein SCO1/2
MRVKLLGLGLLVGVVGACRGEPATKAQAETRAASPALNPSPIEPLPALRTLGDFQLTDQNDAVFTPANLAGKVWLAAFMFTRCPTICPMITARMREVQALAKQRGVPLHLVSFSVDPEFDTPQVLRTYAEKYGAEQSSWSFVTGDNAVIRNAAEEGFKIAVEGKPTPQAVDFGISHGSHLVLVDGKRTIRGYYRSSDAESVANIVRDAARLVAETPRTASAEPPAK